MRDHDQGLRPSKAMQRFDHPLFRLFVKSTGRFVKHEYRGLLVDRTSNSEALSLAA
jgi:hypothetical protein